MKKYLTIAILLTLATVRMNAQNTSGASLSDTLVYRQVAQIDSSLARTGLFASLPSNVTVRQSSAIRDAFISLSRRNSGSQLFTGFRIKVYSDSSQEARSESEEVLRNFHEWYPSISVYRSYESPFFKVIAGEFRTRVDAEKALRMIRASFPAATITKEKMQYPALDDGISFVAENVRELPHN